MPYVEIPSDNEVVAALEKLKGLATAEALCEQLVNDGHVRRDSQLAIQRTAERGRIVIGNDLMLRVASQSVAA